MIIYWKTLEKDAADPVTISEYMASPYFMRGLDISPITWDGWLEAKETWVFVSVDDPTGIFKVNANVTAKYSAGMRIKMVNGGNTIYGIITVVNAYGADEAGYTYIKFLHEIDPTENLALHLMANSAITLPFYSTQKAPFGFPLDPNKWTVEVANTDYGTRTDPTAWTWYNLASISISVPIGIWNISYQVLAYVYDNASVGIVLTTLSTANNSESDADLTIYNYLSFVGATEVTFYAPVSKFKTLSVTTKTPYYLNLMTPLASAGFLRLRGDKQKNIIRAVCAYL